MRTWKFFLIIFLFSIKSLNLIYSQEFTINSIKHSSDSIIDIIEIDSSLVYRVFCRFIKIEVLNGGFRKINQYGIISPDNKKLFLDKNEEYIGGIEDYIYTANYEDKNSITVKSYWLNEKAVILKHSLILNMPSGYFHLAGNSKLLIYFNAAEGYGSNIMLFDNTLNQILDYKPFDGLFKEYTTNEMLSDYLYFSFRSDDNPDEYKVLVFDLDKNQILAEIVIQNIKEYLDQIISLGNGEIVFSDSDLKNFYITRYDYLNMQIINQLTYNFGTRIVSIEKNELLLFNNYDLFSIDISSFSENWKLRLNDHEHENIVLTDYKKLDGLDVHDSSIWHCLITSRYSRKNNLPLDNSIQIVGNNGQLIDSLLLPDKFQIIPNLQSVFSLSSGIRLISGVCEINLIKK